MNKLQKRNRKWCFNDYLCGIISRLPGAVKEIYEDYFVNIESSRIWQSVIFIAILVIAILVIVTVVTFFQQAERKIQSNIQNVFLVHQQVVIYR